MLYIIEITLVFSLDCNYQKTNWLTTAHFYRLVITCFIDFITVDSMRLHQIREMSVCERDALIFEFDGDGVGNMLAGKIHRLELQDWAQMGRRLHKEIMMNNNASSAKIDIHRGSTRYRVVYSQTSWCGHVSRAHYTLTIHSGRNW